jgi:hypothetical protein
VIIWSAEAYGRALGLLACCLHVTRRSGLMSGRLTADGGRKMLCHLTFFGRLLMRQVIGMGVVAAFERGKTMSIPLSDVL